MIVFHIIIGKKRLFKLKIYHIFADNDIFIIKV